MMPEGRPEIPRAIERAVLVEAGHCCAVCGVPCPLERAHIVPWAQTKEHTADNLICLCANCHARADQEKWGAETLRQYKATPWILRRQNGNASPKLKQTLRLELDLTYESFDGHSQDILRYALAGLLQISPKQIRFSEIEPGSVMAAIQLPESAAQDLVRLFTADPEMIKSHLPIFFLKEIIEDAEPSLPTDGERDVPKLSASYPIPANMMDIINSHAAAHSAVGVGGSVVGSGAELPSIAALWVSMTVSLAAEAGHEMSQQAAKELALAVATRSSPFLAGAKIALIPVVVGLAIAPSLAAGASLTRAYGEACARYLLQTEEIDNPEVSATALLAMMGIDIGRRERSSDKSPTTKRPK